MSNPQAIIEIQKNDLPSFYQIASAVSAKKKKYFFLILKINLIVLIAGAFFSALNIPVRTNVGSLSFDLNLISSYASLLAIVVSFLLTIFLHSKKYEKEWYGARAIAESMKTLTWRFMMCSDKFNKSKGEEDVRRLFIDEIREIRNESRYLSGVLSGEKADGPLITDQMLQIRKMSIRQRKDVYIEHRIGIQKTWYSKKAKENEDNGNRYFLYIYILQVLGVVIALLTVSNKGAILNPTGLVATIVASILTWSQVKQFKILSQSYGYTAHELSAIYSLAEGISSEEELSNFVLESEQAISREHTMWLARKVES